MCTFKMLPHRIVLRFVVLFAVSGVAFPAFSQLTLVSSTPTDGQTNAGTLTTFVFQFSAPLDTTAHFDISDGFYLGIEFFPADSVGEPESVTISSDLTTVTATNIALTADTRFYISLTGAKSLTGQLLERPHVINFTTGSSLPSGSVSGEVAFPGGDPSGALVGLFKNGIFFGELIAQGVALSPYTINYVPDGTYFPAAIKDTNRDGAFDISDALGFYDATNDGVPDSIVVAGGAVTGINITLLMRTPETARDNFPSVEAVAKNLAADAQLIAASAPEIMPKSGKAFFWLYGFFSASAQQILTLVKFAGLILPVELEDNGELPDTTALPDNWIDSNIAADSAEANGGSAFRAANPDAEVGAVLLNIPQIGGGVVWEKRSLFATKSLQSQKVRLPRMERINSFGKTAAKSSVAAWGFFYSSAATGEEFTILLDAITGKPLRGPAPAPSAARANLPAANQAASFWAADAALVLVGNATADLSPNGDATVWNFVYYSAAKDSARIFFLISGDVVSQDSPQTQLPSKEALPDGWIDSLAASAVAETNNNFRALHPDAIVQALLSRGLLPGDRSRAVWQFAYASPSTGDLLVLHIDALTGGLITAVEEPELAGLPRSYNLEQNYPNPFNPETVIAYQLPKSGEVELTIFNALGQKVRELVRAFKSAGSYEVRWDGKDDRGNRVNNGIYFYRMQSRDFISAKKLILLP